MNNYVLLAFLLLQFHQGYSLICDVCFADNVDGRCKSVETNCFEDGSVLNQLFLRRYKPACMTFSIEDDEGEIYMLKSCVIDIPGLSPCEVANRTAYEVDDTKFIKNTQCNLCHTDHCNSESGEDDRDGDIDDEVAS